MRKRAKISQRTVVRIIITALILFSLSLNTTTVSSSISDNTTSEPSILALTLHDPIYITSDLGFAVFPGLGIAEDPYIIEGYNITTTSDEGIFIRDTTKYFVIRNCYVNAVRNGICINRVADGTATVINNTCSNNGHYGFWLYDFGNSTVINNTCNNNGHYGISLAFSGNSTVANNTCANNGDDGIELYSSGSSIVANNTCSYNNEYGIYLTISGSSTVANNTCSNNGYYGISLVSSGSSTVVNNTCSNNNEYGIYLWYSDFCVVTYNLLQENEDYGMYLNHSSNNNIIHHNAFVDNNLGDSSQAYDRGRKNKWYDPEVKEGNYWSNLESKCTYKIDGRAHSKDLYPLNRAQSCPNPITLTILSIVLPLLVIVAILAFVVPKYAVPYTRKTIIPYFRKRKAEKQDLIAKLLSCPNCGEKIKLSVPLCENCGTSLPKRKLKLSIRLQLKVLENEINKIIVIVYLVLFLFSISYLPWLITNYDEEVLFIAYPICIFGIGFPLTCLTFVILFRAEINKKLIGKSRIENVTVRSTIILLSILILSTTIFDALVFYRGYHFKDSCCYALLVEGILSLTIYTIIMIFFRSRIAKMPIMKKIVIIISSIISLILYDFVAFYMFIHFCWLF